MSAFMQLLDQKPASAPGSEKISDHDRIASRRSLVDLCRSVLVTNLERFPAEALAILDEHEWENIVRVRYERTKPQKGKGGLDGTGRMNPAIGEKFMSEVETTVPHLAQSSVTDNLVWKDIVEFKFKAGGVSRPQGLLYPGPILEAMAIDRGKALIKISKSESIEKESRENCMRIITEICDMPMDITLLQTSEIGKAVKKFLKAFTTNDALHVFDIPSLTSNKKETPRTRLDSTLKSWKAMAARSGVEITDNDVGDTLIDRHCAKQLARARTCPFWRDLHGALAEFDQERRDTQGARMRQRREKLDSVRPKIVKVRHASSRQNAILDRQSNHLSSQSPNQKIQKLRMEAKVTSMRRTPTSQVRPIRPQSTVAASRATGGFGAAVAVATGHKTLKRKMSSGAKSSTLQLGGNKRMTVPNSKKAAANLKRLAKKGSFY